MMVWEGTWGIESKSLDFQIPVLIGHTQASHNWGSLGPFKVHVSDDQLWARGDAHLQNFWDWGIQISFLLM